MLIAGFYAALGALLILALAIRVMWLRNTRGVGLGSGGDAALARAIRAHANAAEYLLIALLLLVVLAFEQTRPWLARVRQRADRGAGVARRRIVRACRPIVRQRGRNRVDAAGDGAMAVLLLWRFAIVQMIASG